MQTESGLVSVNVFLWEVVTASEAIPSERAIVDFECGVAIKRRVLISKID